MKEQTKKFILCADPLIDATNPANPKEKTYILREKYNGGFSWALEEYSDGDYKVITESIEEFELDSQHYLDTCEWCLDQIDGDILWVEKPYWME